MSLSFYQVRSNDQIYRILRDHYGANGFLRDQSAMIKAFQANNPQIRNIDMIHPGQVIMLPDLSATWFPADTPPREAVQSCRVISESLSRYDPCALDLIKSVDFLKIGQMGGEGLISYVEKAMVDSRREMNRIALQCYRIRPVCLPCLRDGVGDSAHQ
jgi:hypothetical protein